MTDDVQTRLGDAVRAALETVRRTDDVALKRAVCRRTDPQASVRTTLSKDRYR